MPPETATSPAAPDEQLSPGAPVQQQPSHTRRYLRGAGLLIGQTMVVRTTGLLTNILLSRGLNPALLGHYSVVQNTASTGYGIVRLGVENALHLRVAEEGGRAGEERKSLTIGAGLALMTVLGLLGSLALVLGGEWIARVLFGEPSFARWIRWSAVLLLANTGFQFGNAVLSGLHEFASLTRVSVFGAIVSITAIAAGLAWRGLGGAVAGLLAANVVLTIATIVASLAALRRHHVWLRVERPVGEMRDLLRLGGPLYLAGLIAIPITYSMQGLLTRTAGPETLGYLRVIVTLTTLVSFIPTSVSGPALSSLAALRNDSARAPAEFARLSLLNIRVLWLTCLVLGFVIAALLPLLVRVIFGQEYLAAVAVTRIALFTSVLGAVGNTIGTTFFAERRTGMVFAQNSAFALVFGGASALLIPVYGLLGYVAAELLAWSIAAGAAVLVVGRSTRRSGVSAMPLVQLAVLTFISFGAAVAVPELVPDAVPQMIALLLLGAVLAIGGYRWLLSREERTALEGLVRGLRRRLSAPVTASASDA